MTLEEQVKMLTAALEACHEEQSERIRKCSPFSAPVALLTLNEKVLLALAPAAALGRCDHCGLVNCTCAALAATAEPAPTYSADDLRKVAEAVKEECALYWEKSYETEGERYDENVPETIRATPLDAIIAKAVGR